jgi:hypothetical protein
MITTRETLPTSMIGTIGGFKCYVVARKSQSVVMGSCAHSNGTANEYIWLKVNWPTGWGIRKNSRGSVRKRICVGSAIVGMIRWTSTMEEASEDSDADNGNNSEKVKALKIGLFLIIVTQYALSSP